jgi:putative oxidoreductase
MYCRTTSSGPHDFGLLMIRLILGAVFMFHGSQKLFGWFDGPGMEAFTKFIESKDQVPMPQVAAYLSAGTEFVGGLLLLVGFLTRIVAIPVAFNMVMAIALMHSGAFSMAKQGMEYPLTLAVVTGALIFTGAGMFSVDGCMCRPKAPPPADG